MPCNSDYLGATSREEKLSQVACLLDELNGRKWTRAEWDGYHPRVYSQHLTQERADAMVALLCSKLQAMDVTKLSLEMQIWWRDHQEADRKRVERELQAAQDERARRDALAKLTPYERKLLGVSE